MAARTTTRPQPPPTTAARPRSRDATFAGVLLSLAGTAMLLGFITAEALYPGAYTTHANTVSHLGASEPPDSVVLQPSAAIFDLTMLVTGAMILTGAWFAYRALRRRAVLVPTALLGIGALGVGAFPLTHPTPHTLFAFTAFLAGGVAVVVASRVAPAPFRHLWGVLGTVALAATALGVFFLEWGPVAELGEGGIERWIVYPIVLWLVAFGSWLLGGGYEITSGTLPALAAGGALYSGHWHRDARRFLKRHERALRQRPVWLFSSGPLDGSATDGIPPVPRVRDQLQRVGARGYQTGSAHPSSGQV